jgi:hypothetical protein
MQYQLNAEIMGRIMPAVEKALYTDEVKIAAANILRGYENSSVDELAEKIFLLASEVASNTATLIVFELFDIESLDETIDVMYEEETKNLDEELVALLSEFSE